MFNFFVPLSPPFLITLSLIANASRTPRAISILLTPLSLSRATSLANVALSHATRTSLSLARYPSRALSLTRTPRAICLTRTPLTPLSLANASLSRTPPSPTKCITVPLPSRTPRLPTHRRRLPCGSPPRAPLTHKMHRGRSPRGFPPRGPLTPKMHRGSPPRGSLTNKMHHGPTSCCPFPHMMSFPA